MKLNIIIPTYRRRAKLIVCLRSINEARTLIDDVNYTYIYYSEEEEFKIDNQGLETYNWALPRVMDKPYKASQFWNDHFRENIADIYIYINDDVALEINSLKRIVDLMNSNFPDLDGVVAITQKNIPEDQACKTAFGAIGNKFIDRFPNRRVFCEDYERFYFDQEMGEYANKHNKLFYSHDENTAPLLVHFHPAFYPEMMDETHTRVREYVNDDKTTYHKRQKLKLLWGEDFTSING